MLSYWVHNSHITSGSHSTTLLSHITCWIIFHHPLLSHITICRLHPITHFSHTSLYMDHIPPHTYLTHTGSLFGDNNINVAVFGWWAAWPIGKVIVISAFQILACWSRRFKPRPCREQHYYECVSRHAHNLLMYQLPETSQTTK